MTVTRINEFRATDGNAGALSAALRAVVPTIGVSPGCQSCQLLQSQSDPAHLVVLEVWDDVGAHQAAAGRIPSEQLDKVMPLLDRPPAGDYFVGVTPLASPE